MTTFRIFLQSLSLSALTQHVLACHPCGPSDAVAFVNQSTYFNCSTQDLKREIFWYHYPVGVDASGGRLVYRNEKFYDGYTIGFEVEKYRLGDIELYNLVIHNVQLRYAGKYECRDKDSLGNILSAELIVIIESDPKCVSNINPSGVIGPNSCGINPEEIELSCGISYHGNHPPTVQWKSARDNRSISAQFTRDISEGHVTYNTTVTAEYDFDRTSFICQIENMPSSTGHEHSCRTDVVRVLYTFSSSEMLEKYVGDEVILLANASSGSMCIYRWRWYENEDVLTVSSNETLRIERPGMYRCEATCYLRGKQCHFVASHLKASTAPTHPVGMNNNYWIVAVVLPLLCLFIIMTILFVIWIQRRKRKRNCINSPNNEREESKPLTSETCPTVVKDEEIQPRKRKRSDDSSLSQDSHVALTPSLPCTIRTNDAEKIMKPITGLAVLREELFVTFEDSSNVKVYDAKSCDFKDTFDILELENPQDVASDERFDCLYVSSLGKIIKINRNGDALHSWATNEKSGCLSVTNESNVLLSVWQSHLLLEFTAEGEIQQKITLPSNVRLFHAIKLIKGSFIISYANQSAHNVSMINADGEILSQFGGMVKFPKYLSVYGDSECLIVDCHNSRVLTWKSDSSREILSGKDGLKRPVRIYFRKISSQIFVADIGGKDHRVMVFKL